MSSSRVVINTDENTRSTVTLETLCYAGPPNVTQPLYTSIVCVSDDALCVVQQTDSSTFRLFNLDRPDIDLGNVEADAVMSLDNTNISNLGLHMGFALSRNPVQRLFAIVLYANPSHIFIWDTNKSTKDPTWHAEKPGAILIDYATFSNNQKYAAAAYQEDKRPTSNPDERPSRKHVTEVWALVSSDSPELRSIIQWTHEPTENPYSPIVSVRFTPDDRFVVTMQGGTIRLWNMHTLELHRTLQLQPGLTRFDLHLDSSHQNLYMAIGASKELHGYLVRVWDLYSDEDSPVHEITSLDDETHYATFFVSFSINGRNIIFWGQPRAYEDDIREHNLDDGRQTYAPIRVPQHMTDAGMFVSKPGGDVILWNRNRVVRIQRTFEPPPKSQRMIVRDS